jgi:hypothetical protein
MPTLNDLVSDKILKLNPLATVYVAVFQAVSRAIVAEDEAVIYVPWGAFGRIVLVAETPFVDDDLGNRAPAGIRYFVATAAPDQETAMRYLVYVASRLHSSFQLSANASAYPLQLRLMTIWRRGKVPFRELLFEPEISHPINSRLLDINATQNVCSLAWRTGEERIGRAMVQYEVAFRCLQRNEQPMALAHLYIGVETITRALIRYDCGKTGRTEADLGISLGLNPTDERFGGKLETQVRRQMIFQADDATYTDVKKLSDGLEHGFASWEDIWSVPDDALPKTARYLREAILLVLDLPADVRSRLASPPFDSYVEAGPRVAYESLAEVSRIDLRATDFQVAKVHGR